MDTPYIITYLKTLVETDPTLCPQTRLVISEAANKLEGKLSNEEKIQIVMLLISLLGTKFFGGS